jgi:hypothetical protein
MFIVLCSSDTAEICYEECSWVNWIGVLSGFPCSRFYISKFVDLDHVDALRLRL